MNTPLFVCIFVFLIFSPSFSLWDGVVAALTEWIAAEYPPYGEKRPDDKAPLLIRLDRVGRAGRREAAAGRFERRDVFSVEFNEGDGYPFHFTPLPSGAP